MTWKRFKYKISPELILESTNCYKNHQDQYNFITDLYLDFCDRQYMKNMGYKCYCEQDFDFDLCYHNYLGSIEYRLELESIIKECKGIRQTPLCNIFQSG